MKKILLAILAAGLAIAAVWLACAYLICGLGLVGSAASGAIASIGEKSSNSTLPVIAGLRAGLPPSFTSRLTTR